MELGVETRKGKILLTVAGCAILAAVVITVAFRPRPVERVAIPYVPPVETEEVATEEQPQAAPREARDQARSQRGDATQQDSSTPTREQRQSKPLPKPKPKAKMPG